MKGMGWVKSEHCQISLSSSQIPSWMLQTVFTRFCIRKNYTVLTGWDSKHFHVSLQIWVQFACWDYVGTTQLQQPAAAFGAGGDDDSFNAFHAHFLETEGLKCSGVTTLKIFSGVGELWFNYSIEQSKDCS